MKAIVFAKRNFKEIVRDPLSLVFCIGFPIIMFLMFELIVSSSGAPVEEVPQFATDRLVVSISVFSYAFVMLFAGMLVSKDRVTAFLTRLKTSPMKTMDYLIGYFLPLYIISIVQTITCLILGYIFGLKFAWSQLILLVALLPAQLIFIALGILFGSVFNDKTVGGVSSLIISLSSIVSGMFMPLDNMTGAIVVISKIFPFASCINFGFNAMNLSLDNWAIYLGTIFIYLIVIITIGFVVFKKQVTKEH